jgi:hypothetical protein
VPWLLDEAFLRVRIVRPSMIRSWSQVMPSTRTEADRAGCVSRATTRTPALSWCFLCSSGRSSVFADQALDDVGALDPGGHIDRLAGLVQRRSLFP